MELKTLKDIKPYMHGTMLAEFDCAKEHIRQEAIKYIKERYMDNNCIACYQTKKFIIEFFNLKEGDLQ